jgi:hypothetical protein
MNGGTIGVLMAHGGNCRGWITAFAQKKNAAVFTLCFGM